MALDVGVWWRLTEYHKTTSLMSYSFAADSNIVKREVKISGSQTLWVRFAHIMRREITFPWLLRIRICLLLMLLLSVLVMRHLFRIPLVFIRIPFIVGSRLSIFIMVPAWWYEHLVLVVQASWAGNIYCQVFEKKNDPCISCIRCKSQLAKYLQPDKYNKIYPTARVNQLIFVILLQ